VISTYPDTTLTAQPYLIYDHNGVNATTGRLTVVTGATTLAEGPTAGNSTVTQSYFGAGDSIPDMVMTIDVNNSTGALVGGSVSIGFGNNASLARYSWQGAITGFGFASGTGTIFDATWSVSADQYQNMPATMSQFINGFLTGGTGGVKITSSAAWGTTANFGNDWVFGTTPGLASLSGFKTNLTSPLAVTSTVTTDIFASPVPVPAAAWLFASGLGLLIPATRKRK
jgi:hypothetical protein